MVNSNTILEYLEKEIRNYLEAKGIKKTLNFYNEISINEHPEIEIIMKALPGTITNNRLNYPVQLIIITSNRDNNLEEVKNALTEFTINNNEKMFTPNENQNYKIKQFYSTPTVMDAFNSGSGSDYYSTISIEANFIIFEGAIFLNDNYIKINGINLNGIISINESSVHTCDASVKASSPVVDNYVNGIQYSITLDLDFIKNDTLHQKLVRERNENKFYQITYYDGYEEKEYLMIMVNLVRNTSVSSTQQGRISFTTAPEEKRW